MALADGYHLYRPSVADAEQRLQAVVSTVQGLVPAGSTAAASGATGCPETGAAISELGSVVTNILQQLSAALGTDNATLVQAISAYDLAETNVSGAMSSTAGSLPEAGTAGP